MESLRHYLSMVFGLFFLLLKQVHCLKFIESEMKNLILDFPTGSNFPLRDKCLLLEINMSDL